MFVAAVALSLACNAPTALAPTQGSDSAEQLASRVQPTAAPGDLQQPTQLRATEVPEGPPTPTPSFEGIALPEQFGELIEQNGQWTFNSQPVVLTHHTNPDGTVELWLSLAASPAWPLFVQHEDGAWVLGVEEWMGEITIVNTNEVPLQFGVANFDTVQGQDPNLSRQELAAFEISSFSALPPGNYQIVFSFNIDIPVELSCEIELQNDSHYQFVAVPEGIAVMEEAFIPQSASDMDLRTSPLCGY